MKLRASPFSWAVVLALLTRCLLLSTPILSEEPASCADDPDFLFPLDNGLGMRGCEWLTRNSDPTKTQRRLDTYCKRGHVKGACQLSCDFCSCVDNPTTEFTLMNGDKQDCSWFGSFDTTERQKAYCYENQDSVARISTSIGDECVAACGFCSADLIFNQCDAGYVEYENGVNISGECIGNECCRGRNACAGFTGKVCKDGSCNGYEACRDAKIREVVGTSCDGIGACVDSSISFVSGGSCLDAYSCQASSMHVVSGGSCVGVGSCTDVTGASVETQSCVGLSACDGAFLNTVDDNSCVGYRACGNATIEDIVQLQSCVGTMACQDAGLTTVYNSSCVGYEACSDSTGLSATDNSCTGIRSCNPPQNPILRLIWTFLSYRGG